MTYSFGLYLIVIQQMFNSLLPTSRTKFDEQTLYAKCSSSCAKCSEYNGRLGMADNVASLWDQLQAPVDGPRAFEPDLAIR